MRYFLSSSSGEGMYMYDCNGWLFDANQYSATCGGLRFDFVDARKGSGWINATFIPKINDLHEITYEEANATGWRRDLAKPTTYEDCERAKQRWVQQNVLDFGVWLQCSRELSVVLHRERGGAQVKPEIASGQRDEKCNPSALPPPPRDFLTWLASENKRAAVGELPPLQRAHVDAMMARRQERERVAAEANHFHVNEICAALKRRLEKKNGRTSNHDNL